MGPMMSRRKLDDSIALLILLFSFLGYPSDNGHCIIFDLNSKPGATLVPSYKSHSNTKLGE